MSLATQLECCMTLPSSSMTLLMNMFTELTAKTLRNAEDWWTTSMMGLGGRNAALVTLQESLPMVERKNLVYHWKVLFAISIIFFQSNLKLHSFKMLISKFFTLSAVSCKNSWSNKKCKRHASRCKRSSKVRSKCKKTCKKCWPSY